MANRIAHPAAFVLAAALVAAPATATVHHRTAHHHAASKHHGAASTRHRPAKHAAHTTRTAHKDTRPSGVTGVPAGGLKLSCPAHRNPLLIRKSTQGAGTTVTIVCR